MGNQRIICVIWQTGVVISVIAKRGFACCCLIEASLALTVTMTLVLQPAVQLPVTHVTDIDEFTRIIIRAK